MDRDLVAITSNEKAFDDLLSSVEKAINPKCLGHIKEAFEYMQNKNFVQVKFSLLEARSESVNIFSDVLIIALTAKLFQEMGDEDKFLANLREANKLFELL
jgi:hypothetical protein